MEELTHTQADVVKARFLSTASPALRALLRGVGICRVNEKPVAFGIKIMTEPGAISASDLLSHFPEKLHGNIVLEPSEIPSAQ